MRPATRRTLRAVDHVFWMIAGAAVLAVGGALWGLMELKRRL